MNMFRRTLWFSRRITYPVVLVVLNYFYKKLHTVVIVLLKVMQLLLRERQPIRPLLDSEIKTALLPAQICPLSISNRPFPAQAMIMTIPLIVSQFFPKPQQLRHHALSE